ncbi:MAG: thiolase C-terminal domain-containing protein [Planctomycetota bacterium]
MRPVYLVSGGLNRFRKSQPDKTFQALVRDAYVAMLKDLGLVPKQARELIDGSVASYFSDHFTRQLMAGIMVQDYLGLTPKPSHRVEGGGATGGLCLQEAYKQIASGVMEVCLAFGFETMSHVNTWKGNEFIALASDVSFDYPVGGFYSGYYAMMVVRHMHEFGTTVEQLAHVSIKNHRNAMFNPFAQKASRLTVKDVRNAPMVAWPLTREDICVMSDGAAACLVVSEEGLERLQQAGATIHGVARIAGVGRGTDAMRMADRPHGKIPLLPTESAADYKGLKYPGVHSFRAGRSAAIQAYKHAGIADPRKELDFVELHDAYTSSEIQTYEDMGLCKYGEGGRFAASGAAFLPGIDYGLKLKRKPQVPVNPSGGLIACGHPVGATGLMQAVFALWQLQGRIEHHFKTPELQVKNARRGAIHSHAGTGTYVTVTVLEKG